MIYTFTGSRYGMSDAQKDRLRKILREHREIITEFRHGGCVGADDDACAIAGGEFGLPVWRYPSNILSMQAVMRSWEQYAQAPRPPLTRNRDMVREADRVIGAPSAASLNQQRGGTWYTIRYARRMLVPCVVLQP